MIEAILITVFLVPAFFVLVKMHFLFKSKTDRELQQLKKERERLKESLEIFRQRQQ